MSSSKELKKRYSTDYPDKTEFASNARLLQSIWRAQKGYAFAKYGNLLDSKMAKEHGLNFLTRGIFELVKNEVTNKSKVGKVIQEPRIWDNLLSSQPLAFNLFGELKINLTVATQVFQDLFPDRMIKTLKAIDFEFSPGRGSSKYTGDNSAFDVFIEYENRFSEKCFFGIEVKYAEDLNDKPSSHKIYYEEISQNSGVFDLNSLEQLKEKPIQQIWRDHLLALSLFIKNKDYKFGDFIFLFPVANISCKSAIEQYRATFSESKENYFRELHLEKLVSMIKKYDQRNWIKEFEDRYLNFDKILTLSNL